MSHQFTVYIGPCLITHSEAQTQALRDLTLNSSAYTDALMCINDTTWVPNFTGTGGLTLSQFTQPHDAELTSDAIEQELTLFKSSYQALLAELSAQGLLGSIQFKVVSFFQ